MSHSKFPLDLICLSHLRWNFVWQRPQHLLSRAAANHERVFFFEEPIFDAPDAAYLDMQRSPEGVHIAVPHLPNGIDPAKISETQSSLLDALLEEQTIRNYMLWYYTPMALSFSSHLDPALTIYDCMDELSLFKHAPRELLENEKELLNMADLVFTGGQSLYEAKKDRHPHVFAFPSSIDYNHFAHARTIGHHANPDPPDQANIPHPRMGYCGVIDERLDFDLVARAATARPEWQFIFVGPIVKIDPESLPKNPNIHYLGQKDYKELPQYLAGWDVAMMPFALNDSTKFISPTKTPEYLAAGRPVVSTAIRDVVRPYGELGLVQIAGSLDEFIRSAARCGMEEAALPADWLDRVDSFLSQNSWQKTWEAMTKLMSRALEGNLTRAPRSNEMDSLPLNNESEAILPAELA